MFWYDKHLEKTHNPMLFNYDIRFIRRIKLACFNWVFVLRWYPKWRWACDDQHVCVSIYATSYMWMLWKISDLIIIIHWGNMVLQPSGSTLTIHSMYLFIKTDISSINWIFGRGGLLMRASLKTSFWDFGAGEFRKSLSTCLK